MRQSIASQPAHDRIADTHFVDTGGCGSSNVLMNPTDLSALLHDASARSAAYLAGLQNRQVVPSPDDIEALIEFNEPLPEKPSDPAATLDLLDRIGSPATIASAGGRYFGFVNGGALPVAVAAHMLATAWDQNAALSAMSPVAARLRKVASSWLVDLFALPPQTEAMFVGSATVATLCGLVAARDHLLSQRGWDAAADGLFDAPPITVVVGQSAHATIGKALAIIGLGRNRVVTVPCDDQGRMLAGELPDIDGLTIVVAQAGEVNTGAFDPFEAIISWARRRAAWVHIDGAFGLWAATSPKRRRLTAGIEGADSWATDGHKWLNLPYDSGIILMRDPALLRPSMSASASYLPPGNLDPLNHTPQSSQRARAVDAWAALRSLGRAGVAELVDGCCEHATHFARGLREAGHEVLNDVVINQVLVRFGDDVATNRTIRRIQESGQCWCGATVWRGRTAMRISVSSWATTTADVDRSLAAILEAAG